MEDEYNVFGKFETLNCAQILKNVGTIPTSIDDAASTTELFSLSGDDSFCDLEATVSHRKRGNSGKNNKNKLENDLSILDAESSSSQTKRRTRSSTLNKVTATQSLDVPPTNEVNTRRSRSSTSSTNTSSAGTSDTSSIETTSGRGRRKRGNNQLTDFNIPETSNNGRSNRNRSRDVMRARRQYIANMAAKSTTVDVIDLITSPQPRIQGVIDVDNDDEYQENNNSIKEPANLDLSFDEENPEMPVKIVWQGKPETFTIRKYQKFSIIFEQLAKRENVEVDKIFLNLDNQIITLNDTPASINYRIFNFISGRIMLNTKFNATSTKAKSKRDPNLIKLKVQSDKWKRPLTLDLLKTDNFKKLVIKCAEELKMPCKNIKLSFDGESLQLDQTPLDLDFEGGEVLEIHLKN